LITVVPETVKLVVALTRSPARRVEIAERNSAPSLTPTTRLGVNAGRVCVYKIACS
jgi:hypothetical protein